MHEYAIPSLAPGHAVMSKNTGRVGQILDMPRKTPWGAWWLLVAWEDGTVGDIVSNFAVNLGPLDV